jgi:hypothetical protein|tara:strand:- start:327 stop:500 length:174 start_codon:yes stop_codon:yes gene_type:complete
MAITTARYCDGGGIEVQYLDDSIKNERNGLPIVQTVAADDSVITTWVGLGNTITPFE